MFPPSYFRRTSSKRPSELKNLLRHKSPRKRLENSLFQVNIVESAPQPYLAATVPDLLNQDPTCPLCPHVQVSATAPLTFPLRCDPSWESDSCWSRLFYSIHCSIRMSFSDCNIKLQLKSIIFTHIWLILRNDFPVPPMIAMASRIRCLSPFTLISYDGMTTNRNKYWATGVSPEPPGAIKWSSTVSNPNFSRTRRDRLFSSKQVAQTICFVRCA